MLIVIIFRPGNCVCIFVNTKFVAIQISSEIFVILQVASLRSYIEHKIYTRLKRRRIFQQYSGLFRRDNYVNFSPLFSRHFVHFQ